MKQRIGVHIYNRKLEKNTFAFLVADVKKGLAIHKSIINVTDELEAEECTIQSWVITHIESGHAIYSDFKSKKSAIEWRKQFLSLPIDWNDTLKEIEKHKKIIRELINDLRQRGV